MAVGGTSYTNGSYTDPYPTYPESGDSAPSQMSSPGTRAVPDKPSTANPYPLYGDEGAQMLPSESTMNEGYRGAAESYMNPYPVYGLQYAMDKAMVADKNTTHFQSGDVRHADDMSGGNPIERANPAKVSAVSAALDKAAMSQRKGSEKQNQKSVFKQPAKGKKARGGAGDDAARHHAATQADLSSASTGY